MRIVAISDTHGYKPSLPTAGTLIHCGDMTGRGTEDETRDYLSWISKQPARHKLIVPGNHDTWLYKRYKEANKARLEIALGSRTPIFADLEEEYDISILVDYGVTIEGVSFYGTPWSPMFNNWAWMEEDKELHKYFKKIPTGVDVLITHTPAYGVLDRAFFPRAGKLSLGSQALTFTINRAKPKLHLHGHIHASYGELEGETTTYNCALMSEEYVPTNAPWMIEYPVKHI